MDLLCLKCGEEILGSILDKFDNVTFLRDSWDLANAQYNPKTLGRVARHYEVNSIDSVEELSDVYADLLSRGMLPPKCLSGAEYGIFAAGYLNTLIQNSGRPAQIAAASRDKRLMKNYFRNAQLPHANFAASVTLDDIPGLALKYPVVAKPACGTGSFNTVRITDASGLKNYLENLTFHPALYSHTITVEEVLKGDEYHIDAVWRDGKCIFTSISRYIIPRSEVMHDVTKNGSCVLPKSEYSKLYDTVVPLQAALFSQLGLTSGVTHTEFFFDGTDLRFSEFATRFAGAYAVEGLYYATGFDYVEEWLLVEAGNSTYSAAKEGSFSYGGWLNFSPLKDGIVTSVPTREQFLELPWVKDVKRMIEVGDNYQFDNPSVWGVFIAISANSFDNYCERVQELYRTFSIGIDETKAQRTV